ncbi:MAG: hypothetical protein HY294_11645 [Candidatus Rokubacteria bacterium]|nr:hypothetical protein [Candidatus Rokubacteria bacterium]MBI3826642.1 hypothetical protein [Candidatus Rokubacteria bacterium]
MTSLLVLTAVEIEARGLARHLALEAVPGGDRAHFRGGLLEIACVGIGAVELARRAAAWRAPTVVVSAGVCGALAPGLAAGDLVIPDAVLTEDGARLLTAPLPPLVAASRLLSVSRVAATPAAKARLFVQTGAVAMDMESAAILTWAAGRGVPAAVVRAVSDTAAESVPPELAALVEPGGRLRTASAVRLALTRPRTISGALSLGRGTAAALAAVAAALARVARASSQGGAPARDVARPTRRSEG